MSQTALALTPEIDQPAALTPMELISRALAANADVAMLERLMTLQERWEANIARKAFDEAMAAAKGEIGPIRKNRAVDFTSAKGRTNYRYEDLAEIARTVDPVLKKHHLSYRFRTTSAPNEPVSVTCIVSHRLGHSEENTLQAGRDESGNKNSIQAVGSTITFLSRYTLKAALGLAAELDDDDGRATDPRDEEPISDEQVERLQQAATETNTSLQKLCNMLGVAALKDLRPEGYNRARDILDERKRAQAKAPR